MESRSNCQTPTRQPAPQVDKLNRLTRLYLSLGLRSQDALQAADADLKQLAFDLYTRQMGQPSAGQERSTIVVLVANATKVGFFSNGTHAAEQAKTDPSPDRDIGHRRRDGVAFPGTGK